jgi:hypothetical protein
VRGSSNLLYVVILLTSNLPAVSAQVSTPGDICADLKQVAPGDYRDAKGEGYLKVNGFSFFQFLSPGMPVQIKKELLAGGGEFTGLNPEIGWVFVALVEGGHVVHFDKAMVEYVSLTKSEPLGVSYFTEVGGGHEWVRDYNFKNEPVSQNQYFNLNADANKNISALSFFGKALIGQVCSHRVGISQQMFDVQTIRPKTRR